MGFGEDQVRQWGSVETRGSGKKGGKGSQKGRGHRRDRGDPCCLPTATIFGGM